MNNKTVKIVLSIFISLIIFLTIVFLWKEKINFSKPVNHEKMNAYFASIAALGTAFSLFLIYYQSQIMLHASLATYKPDLILVKTSFILKLLKTTHNEKHVQYFTVLNSNDETASTYALKLSLKNIGNGTAKNISATCRKYETSNKEEIEVLKNRAFQTTTSPKTYWSFDSILLLKPQEVAEIDMHLSFDEILEEYKEEWSKLENPLLLPTLNLLLSFQDQGGTIYKDIIYVRSKLYKYSLENVFNLEIESNPFAVFFP